MEPGHFLGQQAAAAADVDRHLAGRADAPGGEDAGEVGFGTGSGYWGFTSATTVVG